MFLCFLDCQFGPGVARINVVGCRALLYRLLFAFLSVFFEALGALLDIKASETKRDQVKQNDKNQFWVKCCVSFFLLILQLFSTHVESNASQMGQARLSI